MRRRAEDERVGVGSIVFRRETGVYEMVARDEDGVLHQLALFRVAGRVFRADASLGRLPWPREAMEADLAAGLWQRAGRVPAAQAVPGARVRISRRFYLWRIARWPYSQFVEPHRNGQYRAVPGLWRAGRRAKALRWLTRSAVVTVGFGVLTAPLFVLGQVAATAVAFVRTAGGRRV
jgi:hypothetical protein